VWNTKKGYNTFSEINDNDLISTFSIFPTTYPITKMVNIGNKIERKPIFLSPFITERKQTYC
jgi:hypothetical protein